MILSDQTVLLTGGAGMVGQVMLDYLYTRTSSIVVVDQNEQRLNKLIQDYPKASFYQCDLANAGNVNDTIESIYSDGHRITILINNAGYIHSEPMINLLSREEKGHAPASWLKTIESNLHSVFYISACIIEKMVDARVKGLLVNISSIASSGNAGQSAYSAAKAGTNALAVTWSKELGMFGIRAAAIAPGFMDLPSTRKALSESNVKSWLKQTPLNRMGDAEELLSALTFIIENDFYNGRVLELDGGLRI